MHSKPNSWSPPSPFFTHSAFYFSRRQLHSSSWTNKNLPNKNPGITLNALSLHIYQNPQYIQKPASHHFYCHHSAQSFHHPSPGFLQEPLIWFLPLSLSSIGMSVVRVTLLISFIFPTAILPSHSAPATMASLIMLSEFPPYAMVLADSSPRSTPPPDTACSLLFCSNVTFSVRLFHDHLLQNNNFILQPHPTHIPYSFSPALFFSTFLVYFVVCLQQLECNLHEVRNFCLFYSLLYPQCLKQCLIHSKCPINICLMNEWVHRPSQRFRTPMENNISDFIMKINGKITTPQ